MTFQVVGLSHKTAPIALRERLAFGPEQTREALDRWRRVFPGVEAVLLSTCNRIELYSAPSGAAGTAETSVSGVDGGPRACACGAPGLAEVTDFLARFHRIEPAALDEHVYLHAGRAAARHLFSVAASLDSMVLGEPQILAQVKQAYQLATRQECTGPLLHGAFQAALHVAARVAAETGIHERRVSIPSVAVADFGKRIFERFDDKHVVVIGAGKMAAETLRYLRDEGAHQITVVNRSFQRAAEMAEQFSGHAIGWDQLAEALATADLVVSTTGAEQPVVGAEDFSRIERLRHGRPLFVLDLAVPRDFDPAIGRRPNVYLFSIDDLKAACDENRRQRDGELPTALGIVEEEAERFVAEQFRRAAAPVIEQLRQGWQKPKEEELRRLLGRLPGLDPRAEEEIRRSFDRLVNKLLHPPLESLRREARGGVPQALLDALRRLFGLGEP